MSKDLLERTAHDILAGADPWPALVEGGLIGVGVPEEAGGSGGTLAEAATVLRVAAYHAAPVPLAETAWLAGWLLGRAAIPFEGGALTAATGAIEVEGDGDGRWLTGTLPRVPWIGTADRLVVLADGLVTVVDPAAARISPGRNLAGEPRGDVTLNAVRAEAVAPTDATAAEFARRGALARAVQICGAARRALDLSLRHASEREQFGRPIGRFQAVQHMLAELAGEVTVADVAVRAAVAAPGDPLAVAAAKAAASRAAGTVATIAHQVHGAIGVTHEHPLRQVTLRLWSWREEFGDDTAWSGDLGARLAEADDPWALITGGP